MRYYPPPLHRPKRTVLDVPREVHGARLEDFLARQFEHVRKAELRQLLANEGVRVNGQSALGHTRLREFDVVEVEVPEQGFADRADVRTDEPLAVLAEGEHWLVVDKPAGLMTVPGRQGHGPSVHAQLPTLRPDADLRIVHRLDRFTSGCLLLAKGIEAARWFDEAFSAARVHKTYVALVHGVLPSESRIIDLPLMADPRRPGKTAVARGHEREAKPARTEVAVTAVHGDFSLLSLHPQTGRSHQLRCHLAAIGHPIVADVDYGGRPLLLSELKRGYKLRRGVRERALLERTFLHAASLRFPALDGAEIAVESPLPADLRTALDRLERTEPARN